MYLRHANATRHTAALSLLCVQIICVVCTAHNRLRPPAPIIISWFLFHQCRFTIAHGRPNAFDAQWNEPTNTDWSNALHSNEYWSLYCNDNCFRNWPLNYGMKVAWRIPLLLQHNEWWLWCTFTLIINYNYYWLTGFHWRPSDSKYGADDGHNTIRCTITHLQIALHTRRHIGFGSHAVRKKFELNWMQCNIR